MENENIQDSNLNTANQKTHTNQDFNQVNEEEQIIETRNSYVEEYDDKNKPTTCIFLTMLISFLYLGCIITAAVIADSAFHKLKSVDLYVDKYSDSDDWKDMVTCPNSDVSDLIYENSKSTGEEKKKKADIMTDMDSSCLNPDAKKYKNFATKLHDKEEINYHVLYGFFTLDLLICLTGLLQCQRCSKTCNLYSFIVCFIYWIGRLGFYAWGVGYVAFEIIDKLDDDFENYKYSITENYYTSFKSVLEDKVKLTKIWFGFYTAYLFFLFIHVLFMLFEYKGIISYCK